LTAPLETGFSSTISNLHGRLQGPGTVSPDALLGPVCSFCSDGDYDMRGFDLTPYRRSTVGFDRLFDLIENNARLQQGDNYPPFNIERLSEDRYRVTLAVAGFRPDEIDITAQQNLLQVVGRKDDSTSSDRSKFLHVGIANRSFERRFELADFVRVEKADLADGLLTVDLVREIPEAMKPKKIAINGGQLVEISSDRDAA
jgi:molecular chaperone IbpA